MESVFHISYCAENYRVNCATCTFMNTSLAWWNNYTRATGIDLANAKTWEELKLILTGKYYPRDEIQKLEKEV